MPTKGIIDSLDVWIRKLENRNHLEAVKYIEENVDLLDIDLQKFMDDCPSSCQLEVYEMLLKAGIDLRGYVMNSILKKWDIYIHDSNSPFHQYYTIDYKQGMNECINEILTCKTDGRHNSIVLDTIPAVEEA